VIGNILADVAKIDKNIAVRRIYVVVLAEMTT
jgi:hypothetical protein